MNETLMKNLTAVDEVLNGAGESMPGSLMSNELAIQTANERYPGLPYCLIRDWRWFDLSVPDIAKELVMSYEVEPVIVYSNNIVLDLNDRFPPGGWVKTSLLKHWDEDGFFVTCNTVYVLLGARVRLPTTLEVVSAIC